MVGVTEADRQRIVEELQRRAVQGQLTTPELEDRIHRVRTVITLAGLEGILLDLPGEPAPSSQRPWALPDDGPEPEPAAWPAGGSPGGDVPAAAGAGSQPQRPRPRSRMAVGVAVTVTALVVLGAVAGQLGRGSPESSADGATTVPSTPSTAPTASSGPETTAAPTTAAPSAPPTTGRSGDPLVLEVGRQIQPGIYTTGPAGTTCRWRRFQAAEAGGPDVVVAEDVSARPIIEVLPTDSRVRLQGCAPLAPYAPPATPATTVGDGDWLVGRDVAPGHFRVTAPDPDSTPMCTWTRARGLGYGAADVIDYRDHYGTDLRTEVDLAAGERFSTSGCGTWTLQ